MNLNIYKTRKLLLAGEVIIVPTETVYGLAVIEKYRDKLDQVKNQPKSKPMARIYSSVKPILNMVEDILLKEIVSRLLPGPFTLLLNVPEKTGFRVPEHPIWSELLQGVEEVVLMTSANIHGEKPAVTFTEAKAIFPQLEGFDGGPSYYRRASTIIDLTSGMR